MADIDLAEKFPDLQPIKGPPSLFSVNGFGVSMYGRRDFDDETGTYIKTQCLSALFIPLLALRSYRVADAGPGQGWYFIGREPLSGVARFWNVLLVCGIVVGAAFGGWRAYTGSPEYQAKRMLAAGDRLLDEGRIVEAARKYRDVVRTGTGPSTEAAARVQSVLSEHSDGLPPEQAVELMRVAVDVQQTGRLPRTTVVEKGRALAERHAAGNPKVALEILDIAAPEPAASAVANPAPADPQELEHAALRTKLLESIVAADPDDVQLASRLAALYERAGKLEQCEQLLAPRREKLGATEGARILGQIHSSRGEFELAHSLLVPYCEQRLEQLHAVEKEFELEIQAAQRRILVDLNEQRGPPEFYRQYEAADEAGQRKLVEQYVTERLDDDPMFLAAQQKLIQHGSVVPVALELGMVLLRRAQTIEDPEQRQAELEQAEKTFLAIRGHAGDSDQYRMFLGQVYYWLGRQDEGRGLFDELLESKQRDAKTLLAVGNLYRGLGSESEARSLAEEAYEKAVDDDTKHNAAGLRAMLQTGLDDRINWLQRNDAQSPQVQADLAQARGDRAVQDGDNALATRHYRQAIEHYSRMPESAAMFNNSALVQFALFSITGNKDDYEIGIRRLDRAVALSPSDAILLNNSAELLLDAAWREIVGDAIDLHAAKVRSKLELLGFLYDTDEGRAAMAERVRSHAGVTKALDYLDKVFVLSPKRTSAYRTAADVHQFTDNLAELQRLKQRLDASGVDAAESIRESREFYQGSRDDEFRRHVASSLARQSAAMNETRGDAAPTFAAAVGYWIQFLSIKSMMGEDVDHDEMVQRTESAVEAAPSREARRYYVHALSMRADTVLAGSHAAYAELRTRTQRTMTPEYRLAAILSQGGPLAEAVGANADAARVIELTLEDLQRFPRSATGWQWALLGSSHPEDAARIAEQLAQDEASRLIREIDLALAPATLPNALEQYWALRATGHPAEAAAVLESVAKHGIELPFAADREPSTP